MRERTDGLTCTATETRALLFFVFALAFLLTPYWRTLATPASAWTAFVLSVPLGMCWATVAGSGVRLSLPHDARAIGLLVLALALCLAIDLRALNADIPWHGDEDFHVMASAPLAMRLRPYAPLAALAVVAYVTFTRVAARGRWLSFAAMLALAGLAFVPTPVFEYERFDPLRYPFLSRYLAAAPILLSSLVVLPTPEIVYRVVPFLSALGLAWLTARRSVGTRPAALILVTLFAFTVPVLLYYSSILYLELPAALLMLVVAFHADTLLANSAREVMTEPAWLALVLIGFLKETALPFLAAFLVCRLLVQATRWMRGAWRWDAMVDELQIAFTVALPLAIYLAYRSQRSNLRAPSYAVRNAADVEVWTTFARSYLEQFGVLLVLSAAGIVLLLMARRYATVLLLLTAYAFDTALHVVDYKEYAGYSRFNLFVLPLALVAAAATINWAYERAPRVAGVVLATGIFVNVLMSPVNADGSKQPFWGNRLIDTSEHYYPYKKAGQWIRDHGLADARIRFTGMPDRYYAIGFLKPFPNQDERLVAAGGDEARTMEQALDEAAADGREVVVYHVVGHVVPAPARTAGFLPGETIANQAHALVVFRKAEP